MSANGKLIIKDPVFAAYLLFKGHEPKEINPYIRGERPKTYVYGPEVRDAHYDRPFLGSRMRQEKASWRDFLTWMNRLIEIESLQLNQHHDGRHETGLVLSKLASESSQRQCFATTDQAVAAFILGFSDKIGSILVSVQSLGKGYRFVFTEGAAIYEEYGIMLQTGEQRESWCTMKSLYKLATMIRREQTENSSWL